MISDLAKVARKAAEAAYTSYLSLQNNPLAKRDELVAAITVYGVLGYLARAAEDVAAENAAKVAV